MIFDEVKKRSGNQGKMTWVLQSIMDEVLDTLEDEGRGEDFSEYMLITSQVMRWVATGELEDLPEEYRVKVTEQLALPAGDTMLAHK